MAAFAEIGALAVGETEGESGVIRVPEARLVVSSDDVAIASGGSVALDAGLIDIVCDEPIIATGAAVRPITASAVLVSSVHRISVGGVTHLDTVGLTLSTQPLQFRAGASVALAEAALSLGSDVHKVSTSARVVLDGAPVDLTSQPPLISTGTVRLRSSMLRLTSPRPSLTYGVEVLLEMREVTPQGEAIGETAIAESAALIVKDVTPHFRLDAGHHKVSGGKSVAPEPSELALTSTALDWSIRARPPSFQHVAS